LELDALKILGSIVDFNPNPNSDTNDFGVESDFIKSTIPRGTSQNLDLIGSDDTIGLYFKEMGHIPLLSQDEEVALAKQIERARIALNELSTQERTLKLKRRAELEHRIRDGYLARERLIKSNTRLVVSIAKKYLGNGVPFLDLIQEGNLGLMRAVEKFEYQRGFRFSTYATWWKVARFVSRYI
jgi:RNA polymerase primary sigma factor